MTGSRIRQMSGWLNSERMMRLRSWGVRGGLAVVDQVLFSGSNFAINILLARWLIPEEYGAYSIAFSILMFFYQVYFSFVLEPMSVLGPANYSGQIKNYLFHQFKLHLFVLFPLSLFGVALYCAATAFPLPINKIILYLLLMLIYLPFSLLPWFFRRAVYVLQLPGVAALSSGGYGIFLLVIFIVMRKFGFVAVPFAIVSMAVAGLLGASLTYLNIRRGVKISHLSLKGIAKENWFYGKWLVASSLLVILAGQVQIFIVGSVLDVESAGILRALQNFSQPPILVVTAFGNLAIPALSRDFSRSDFRRFRNKISVISVVSIFMASIYLLGLFYFRNQLELFFYNGQYARYADVIPVQGIVPLLLAVNVAQASALQAAQKPYALLIVSFFWLVASIGSGILFSELWGILGGAWSSVLGYLVMTITFWILYKLMIVNKLPKTIEAQEF
jgi:O-antigen/teichoic acid export membrane protein